MSNPCLLYAPLQSDLQARDRAGVFTLTSNGPVRFESGGRGYYAEEATTNYAKNPLAIASGGGYASGLPGSVSLSYLTGVGMVHPAVGMIDSAAQFTWINPFASGNTIQQATDKSVAGGPFAAQALVRGSASTIGKTFRLQMYEVGASVPTRGLTEIVLTGNDQWLYVTGTYETSGNDARLLGVLPSGSAAGDSILITGVQIEDRAYPTSLCAGSMGSGYSWAGTAHASASSRVVTVASAPSDGHINSLRGSFIARCQRSVDTGALQTLFQVGQTGVGNDLLGMRYRSDDGFEVLWVANGSQSGINTGTGFTAIDTALIGYCGWNGTDVIIKKYAVAAANLTTVTGTRSTPSGVLPTALRFGCDRNNSSHLGGPISDVMIFDRPLTDAEFAKMIATPQWSFDMLGTPVSKIYPSIGIGI